MYAHWQTVAGVTQWQHFKIGPEGVPAGACWIEIIEPAQFGQASTRGGYMLADRQVQ